MSPSQPTSLQSAITHFAQIPWCNTLITTPGWTPIPTRSREPKPSTEDSFFAHALQTPTTLSAHLTLVQAPSIPLPQNSSSPPSPPIERVRTLWTLNSDVNGYPGVAHGGLLGALCDEGMGILLTARREYGEGKGTEISEMTVYLNLKFKAPVQTPGTVVVETWVEKRMGRKTVLRASVRDKHGRECVGAEGLFVSVPNSRL